MSKRSARSSIASPRAGAEETVEPTPPSSPTIATNVAFDGTRFRGPSEPEAHLARLFDTVLYGSRLEGEVESVRFVATDVAVGPLDRLSGIPVA